MATVAGILEDAMARRGFTQQRLAREVGMTAPWINMILRRSKAPGPEALLKLADVLGLDPRELVRQAHYERAYEAWKPYLEPSGAGEDRGDRPLRLAVIGTASAGAAGGEVEVATAASGSGSAATSEPPARHPRALSEIGFDRRCRAIRVEGDSLEPVAYDGQFVVISPLVRKEDIPDGSLVYLTYELPGEARPRATVKRMYRYRLAGEEPGEKALPVYVFVPVNTHLRRKGRSPEPQEAFTLRHRQVREMYPVVGVVFGDAGAEGEATAARP